MLYPLVFPTNFNLIRGFVRLISIIYHQYHLWIHSLSNPRAKETTVLEIWILSPSADHPHGMS